MLEAWARDGLTKADIAHNMGIGTTTLWEWEQKYPDIKEAIKRGKEVTDIIVENALYKNATGYKYTEQQAIKVRKELVKDGVKQVIEDVKLVEVEKHKMPETVAQLAWLNNRKPEAWRDRRHVENTNKNIQVDELSGITDEELKKIAGIEDE